MRYLVLYDSVFGNTEKIASAVSKALGSEKALRVHDARQDDLSGLDLLVVGSPTRGFRPTKELNDFLGSIPAGRLKGVKVAAFDTRISPEDVKSGFLRFMVGIFGYAAKPIAGSLQKKGGNLAGTEGFFVKDTKGPLKEGELERASAWAKGLKKA